MSHHLISCPKQIIKNKYPPQEIDKAPRGEGNFLVAFIHACFRMNYNKSISY